MLDKLGDAAADVLYDAYGIARRFKTEQVACEHILAALVMENESIASQALTQMNINADSLIAEIERTVLAGKKKDIAPAQFEVCDMDIEEIKFAFQTKLMLKRAREVRSFFGHKHVEPEHILLALLEVKEENCMKILEELGANVTFLKSLLIGLMAKRDSINPAIPNLKDSVINGLDELVDERINVLDDIERLSATTDVPVSNLPQKAEVAHLVFTAYMPDYLLAQIAYQRYLLEETLNLLRKRCGNLDPEFAASTVSTSAQNIRSEVRQTVEYVWSHEFRLMSKLPDDADYDLIGSVIEDLWWTHSEEIALNQVFGEALDDHRRQQMLNLQKRRLEIEERYVKLRLRLTDTIRQCFLKRTPA
ncbi:MAG: hypothetical protein K2X77_06010 [Candidatus Obscuribacterales bacterium]|jgi:ATP-dependent Clp protease ATP-binding subunit ClpA|nr:hypothetical protein [Candidatus Obscuribacterales bacterium]